MGIDIKVENEYFGIENVKDENLIKTESRTEKVAVDAIANIKEDNQNFDETKSENLEVDEQQGMDDIEDEALLKRHEHIWRGKTSCQGPDRISSTPLISRKSKPPVCCILRWLTPTSVRRRLNQS